MSITQCYLYCAPLSLTDALPISRRETAEDGFRIGMAAPGGLQALPGQPGAKLRVIVDFTVQDQHITPARRDHGLVPGLGQVLNRSEEHTSELQSLMRISYAVL